jgi:methionine-rich copper-binding protein CopC
MMKPIVLAFVLAAAQALTASAASAHAMLEHALPAAGTTLAKSPGTLTLQFSENLEPAFSSIAVTDDAGRSVTAGASSAGGSRMSVPLMPLRPGRYRVVWHALSLDTHRTQGSYTFTIGPR